MKGKKPLIGSVAGFALALVSLVITSSTFAAGAEKVLYSFCAASNCADGGELGQPDFRFGGKSVWHDGCRGLHRMRRYGLRSGL